MRLGFTKITSFVIFLLGFQNVFGQITNDISFDEKEVSEYEINATDGQVILKMAYAEHQIKNPEDWRKVSKQAHVNEVDLVFTKYPRQKQDWITDYDFLLNARVKNLLSLIPNIKNNKNVKWNIILQNKCVKEPQAKKMFHGAIIHYEKKQPQSLLSFLDTTEFEEDIDKKPHKPIKKIAKKPKLCDGEKYKYIGFYDLDKIIKGKLPIEDSLIFHVLERNPTWKDILVVSDWTASMYVYGAQALMWHKENIDKEKIDHFIFFNDGNKRQNDKKIPGKTGGIYGVKADDTEKVIATMRKVMGKGQGGDREENDVEALTYAIKKYKEAQDIILIADNKSEVRDLSLINQIDKPVRVIVCGTTDKSMIREDYLRLARETKGSIHTLKADYKNLHQLSEGETIFIEDIRYQLVNHQLKMIVDMLD